MKPSYMYAVALAIAIEWCGVPSALAESSNLVSFAVTNTYATENSGSITVLVTRAGTADSLCSATIRTVAGTAAAGRDFIAVTTRLEFAAGQTLASQMVTLVSDTVPEASKRFILTLDTFSNCVAGVLTNMAVIIHDAQTVETLAQDFESGLPAGWSVVGNADTNGVWRFDNPGGRANGTGGEGAIAIADSDFSGEVNMDTELRTAPFSVAATAPTYLVFKTYYLCCSGYEIADVDMSVDGEAGPWTNLWRRAGHDYGPATEMIDLTPIAQGQSNVMVRFHYYNANYDWYWQIDDVAILVESDSNTNGLPDWWETAYYSCLTNLDASSDTDHDGASASNEFVAGTSPTDTGSCFRVTSFVCTGGVTTVRFPTEIGHFYDLLSCTNLTAQAWTTRVSRLPGAGGLTNLQISTPEPRGFCRLNVHRW